MPLLDLILNRVKSQDSIILSPPPEGDLSELEPKKKKPRVDKFAHVQCKVDTSPPPYDPRGLVRRLEADTVQAAKLLQENIALLSIIKQMHYSRGRVDCRWARRPPPIAQYHTTRVNFYKHVMAENKQLYQLLSTTGSKLTPTAELERSWAAARREQVRQAGGLFLLAPPPPQLDPAFAAPPGFKRTRVTLSLGFRSGARLGALPVELFTDACPRTCALFTDLLQGDGRGHCYVGTRFYSSLGTPKEPDHYKINWIPQEFSNVDTTKPSASHRSMLVPDAGPSGGSEMLIKVISPEGQTFTAYFPEDALIEEVKNRALDYFYPSGESGASRFKIVRVFDTTTLHDFLTLGQENVMMQEELLLVERRLPEAGTLWDLGAIRAPQHATIAAATATLPPARDTVRQPNLQSLLSTNELSYELRKILISLVEAGARLAAAGKNYEMTLAQLSAALDEPRRAPQAVIEVITPEDIAARLRSREELTSPAEAAPEGNAGADELYRRADHLQRFLEKFRAWRMKLADVPSPDAVSALKDLGFAPDEADRALRNTGCNVPAAAAWLIGERGSSVFELVNGLPDGLILQTLLKQPQIQRGLLNTRMLTAFIAMVGQTGSAGLWLNSPHGSPLLSQISRTYHSEKYCLAVNQFSERREDEAAPSTSRKVPGLYWSGGDVTTDTGFGCYAPLGRAAPPTAENYHYPHCVPGLLTMHVTRDDEVCGTFTITFKPLPHLDLRSTVFGRVVLPSRTFESMRTIGNPFSTQPVVEIRDAKFPPTPRYYQENA